MKFLSLALLLAAAKAETETAEEQTVGMTGEEFIGYGIHDGSTFNSTVGYDGTCLEQSYCLFFTVSEVHRRCGSGSCEFEVCWSTFVGNVPADSMWDYYYEYAVNRGIQWQEAGEMAAKEAIEECKLHPDYGVDYAGDMATDRPDEDTGGCTNVANSQGKGFWDETCINPEVADEATTGIGSGGGRFRTFCQVARPGETVHFMMHSIYGLDWNGQNAEKVSCKNSAPVTMHEDTNDDDLGSATCGPSSQNGPNGQTWFPANDGSTGGTCSDAEEGDECVWSYTAPTADKCKYQENWPICYISEESVNTVTSTCEDGEPIVEYFEHPNNPNGPPPKIPLHDLVQNGDGTISFNLYNPYGDYIEPIHYEDSAYTSYSAWLADWGSTDEIVDMYVVYDQANEIGNEVCDVQWDLGVCPKDDTYTAKCRSDGVAIVTVFLAGEDINSAVAADVTSELGTQPFECCPANYRPDVSTYSADTTVAWTFLVHCDCPEDATGRRRQLRESLSSQFQNGELFESENLKKLYELA